MRGVGQGMKLNSLIRSKGRLEPEDQAEFDAINTRYNSGVSLVLSLIVAVLLSGSMLVGYISDSSGAAGVDEFWVILPYHVAGIIISLAMFAVMLIIRRKNMSASKLADAVAAAQIGIIMVLILISAHVEIPFIGIKNINTFILAMFAVAFFLRFNIKVTLFFEIVFTGIIIVFLLIEKNDISNFYPSFINIICCFIIASLSAVMYWDSRRSHYLSTKELELLATADHLTRLHNRRSFDLFIEREWKRALDEGLVLSLLIIDADYFKKYNDIYGHPEGDKCLCAIAGVISSSIRKNDFAARYGGEEFVVALTGVNLETTLRIAAEILENMRAQKIPHSDSVIPYVTVSIGGMTRCPGNKDSVGLEDFIRLADEALYMAKEQGRNRFVLHPEALTCK